MTQSELPDSQKGGLPGSQVVTCLWCAQQLLYKEYRTGRHGLWLLEDVRQAFDSLNRSVILQHLLKGPPQLPKEATAIYKCICSHMTFRFGDEWWKLVPNTGTQGSLISAGLFAIVLGEAVDQLFNMWQNNRSVRPRHRDHAGRLLFGWCYADDCIFNFDSWSSFKRGLSDIIAAFAELGLHLNLDKTQLVVHPDWYQEGLDFFASDPDHPATQCKWVTVGEYLRRPLRKYQAETSVSSWVLEAALKATHAGWESIARPLKACDLRSPSEALVLLGVSWPPCLSHCSLFCNLSRSSRPPW